ncbi:hypothetical protein GOARA_061_01560 [Gordonia araii NBRC 100433]|uniref:Uncharacterized protein n=1 Tax=Gordonia araii NBRC 100433 TaxID=1073574 RepID=G7H4E1_9ACTN|nr:hypothetical protein GOARA_061_01560 [Gordonia araii NBRC 100433]
MTRVTAAVPGVAVSAVVVVPGVVVPDMVVVPTVFTVFGVIAVLVGAGRRDDLPVVMSGVIVMLTHVSASVPCCHLFTTIPPWGI